MTKPLYDAVQRLTQAAAEFESGKLTAVAHSTVREAALSDALRAVAQSYGVTLQEPLQINGNGEFSIVASRPGETMLNGCGKFGAEFADALNAHHARTGNSPTRISGDNGWCYLHHQEAEAMVLFELLQPNRSQYQQFQV
jgi:hypothetical protein